MSPIGYELDCIHRNVLLLKDSTRDSVIQVALAVNANLAAFEVLPGVNVRACHHYERQADQWRGDQRTLDSAGKAGDCACNPLGRSWSPTSFRS